jgi:hypothetical protein
VEKWVDPMLVKLVGEIVERWSRLCASILERKLQVKRGKRRKLKRVQSFPHVFDC